MSSAAKSDTSLSHKYTLPQLDFGDEVCKLKITDDRSEGGEHDDANEETPIVFNSYEGVDWVQKYWGPTRDITLEKLTSLVKSHYSAIHGDSQSGSCILHLKRNGVYNTAYILKFENGTKVCVRVPACGWSERWNEKDAELLRSTVLVMKLIGAKTTIPLPKVFAYDTSLDNEINAPFIIMSCLEGYSARQAWMSDDWEIPKEIRRQNLLRSLAQAMSGLGSLKFSRAGSLWFSEGCENEAAVGESWTLRVEGFVVKRTFESHDPYASTRVKVQGALQHLLAEEGFPDNCRGVSMGENRSIPIKGVLLLYQLMVETFLDAAEIPEAEEEFGLMHSDYDIQNLVVDREGNVTGIHDWDGVAAVPLQIGCVMLPFWLQSDWCAGYCWPPAVGIDRAMLRPEEFEKYRQDFARHMWDGGKGVTDCRYSSKSHIYRTLLNSLGDRFDAYSLVLNILNEVLPRVDGLSYCRRVGARGFQRGENKWLQGRLRDFFRPEIPMGQLGTRSCHNERRVGDEVEPTT